jgi:hypothetical protein
MRCRDLRPRLDGRQRPDTDSACVQRWLGDDQWNGTAIRRSPEPGGQAGTGSIVVPPHVHARHHRGEVDSTAFTIDAFASTGWRHGAGPISQAHNCLGARHGCRSSILSEKRLQNGWGLALKRPLNKSTLSNKMR